MAYQCGGQFIAPSIRAKGLVVLPVSEKDLLQIEEDGSCILWIYGAIGNDYSMTGDAKWVDHRTVAKVLDGRSGPRLEIRISSGGGHAEGGFAIYDCLVEAKKTFEKVETLITGQAYSMGSVIALAGDTVRIYRTGEVGIHQPTSRVQGPAHRVLDAYESLVGLQKRMIQLYSEKTGKTVEEITGYLTPGFHYLTPEEALEFGLVDEIVEAEGRVELQEKRRWGLADRANRPIPLVGEDRSKRGETRMLTVAVSTEHQKDGSWKATSDRFEDLVGYGKEERVAVNRLQGAILRDLAYGFETMEYPGGNIGLQFKIVDEGEA